MANSEQYKDTSCTVIALRYGRHAMRQTHDMSLCLSESPTNHCQATCPLGLGRWEMHLAHSNVRHLHLLKKTFTNAEFQNPRFLPFHNSIVRSWRQPMVGYLRTRGGGRGRSSGAARSSGRSRSIVQARNAKWRCFIKREKRK